jgi:hypothetical protein
LTPGHQARGETTKEALLALRSAEGQGQGREGRERTTKGWSIKINLILCICNGTVPLKESPIFFISIIIKGTTE